MGVYDKVKHLAEQRGVTITQLEKRKIEANEYMRICDALGLPLDYFRPRLPENASSM